MKKLFYIAIILFLALTLQSSSSQKAQKFQFSRKLEAINSIVKELQTNYVDTLNAKEVMDYAINSLLYQVDPYTEYYPAEDQDEILSISSGQYAGIGSYIQKRKDIVIISEPQWDTPSHKAGLRAGDQIIAIDGDTITSDMNISAVSSKLRGQAGTIVKVDVKRQWPQDTAFTVSIVRDNIVVNPVPYAGVRPNGIGYISITTFNESTSRRVKAAILEMLKDPNLKGLIIDLRNNGGGLLESAVQVASNFVERGTEIVRTRGRNPQDEKIYKTTQKPIARDLPLAILINGNSASSSEILAGALQDLDRAVIVGERSYGKGLVQSTRPLPHGEILKITTGRYYIPSGRLIQALDYRHRNPDGSPMHIPDSLSNEFTTKAGRIVRDGGGITPDIIVESPQTNRLLYNIMADNWAFDFATQYAANFSEVPDPNTFAVDSTIFEAFKAFIDPVKFSYDKACETRLKNLREAAELEGYMTDSVEYHLNALASLLKHNLDYDLDNNYDEIVYILDDELCTRFYPDDIIISRSVDDAFIFVKASEILLNAEEYKKILSK